MDVKKVFAVEPAAFLTLSHLMTAVAVCTLTLACASPRSSDGVLGLLWAGLGVGFGVAMVLVVCAFGLDNALGRRLRRLEADRALEEQQTARPSTTGARAFRVVSSSTTI